MGERWRDIAGPVGRLAPGSRNAITDVPGVLVGHSQASSGERTGITVVAPPALPASAGRAVANGAGELTSSFEIEEQGKIETPVYLCGTHALGTVYQAAIEATGRGPDDVVIPTVGECDDGDMADSRTVVAAEVEAARQALGPEAAEGSVGAGTGMICFGYPGGIGTASRVVGDHHVGVLLLCNFGIRADLDVLGVHPDPAPDDDSPDGSCIAVCATDAPLAPHQLRRLAMRPLLGLARAGSFASEGSGEIGVAFAAVGAEAFPNSELSPYFAAAWEAAHEAVLNCLVAARPAERLDGTRQAAFPVEAVRAAARAREGMVKAWDGGRGAMGRADLEAEVLGLAQALIRFDTSNPPGNETPAAEMLAAHLQDAGAECELAGPDPERLNLIARVKGRGEGPSLMLLAHTDVVPAPADDWTVPPFEGRVRDGQLVGRGASDMKGELASRATALAVLARRGEPPAGDVVLVAESDEERNVSDVGLSWLVREREDIRCDYALNEGGGMLLELANGRRVVTVSVGEKQVCSLRIRVRGRSAHAGHPIGSDNPLRHASAAVQGLLATKAATTVPPALARVLESIGAPDGSGEEAVSWAAIQHPVLASEIEAMTSLTVTPTGLQTHEPANVIPPFADVICDCRALPGQGFEDIRAHIGAALGDGFAYELELLEPLEGGTESPIDTSLYAACEAYLAERLPGAALLPAVTPGFTDSHWIRRAFDTVAYGFAPVFSTDAEAYVRSWHGPDESLDIADLVEMTEFNLHAIETLPQLARP